MGIFQKPIALDPGRGGVCIGPTAMQAADIIVATTSAAVSLIIREHTNSVVSHVLLYAGNNEVIEAIGEGVVRRPLAKAIEEDALAVVYRSPNMTALLAKKIVDYANQQAMRKAPYSVAGAALSTDKVLCQINSGTPTRFFCSQLVLESYKQGGRPLTELPPQCGTPQDVVMIAIQRLVYVGHLLGNPSWFPIESP